MTAIPSRRRTLAALSLCAFAYLYAFPYQPQINNPNENVRFYMTAALAERGTYVIDAYRERWGWVNDCAVREGHAFSVKAPATSFLGVPPYWVYARFVQWTGSRFDRVVALWVCRVFASILPWLLFLYVFYRFAGRYTSSPLVRDGVFLSVAIGSCLYGYGLLFMSHTLSAAAAFGAFMLLHDARQAGRMRRGRAFLAGLLAASVTLLEYPGFVASALLSLYALCAIRQRSRLIPYALGALIPTAAMMHFQWRCFGSPFSPGHLYVENDFFRGRHEEGFFGAVGLQPEALYGLLVHPGAGLLPLTPILLAAIPGFCLLLKARRTRLDGSLSLGVFLLTLLGIAVMNNWRGGWTIGPRYLAVVYPFLALAALRGLEPFVRRWPRVTGSFVVGSTLVGFLLSGLPSVYYPHYPVAIDRPVTQVVAVLLTHDFAPLTALHYLGVYGTLSMAPIALAVMVAVVVMLFGQRGAAVVGAGGLLFALLVATPLLVDPRPDDPEVLEARGFIAGHWDPPGHDRAARLHTTLRANPDAAGYRRLSAIYREEGRHGDADRAARQAERLQAVGD